MPDTLGTITVPELSPDGTFPLQVRWPFATILEPQVKIHRFGAGNAKREQRFLLGDPTLRRWQISQEITSAEWDTLVDFWEDHNGSGVPFTFAAPNADQTFTSFTAQFENEPLAVDRGRGKHSVTVNLRQVYTGAGPTYAISATQTRFPSGSLATGLAEQAQNLIPLLKIQPKEAGYPAIYVSDRRCTVGGQVYLARLLDLPEIRQSAIGVPGPSSETDDVTFTFGNADRVMRDLAASTNLEYSWIEYGLYHVGSGVKLDLWAGEVQRDGWDVDGLQATLRGSDRIANQFVVIPNRTCDRGCKAAYNKPGGQCDFATNGALDTTHYPSADASFCDHGYETDNGCLAHGMSRYYRGVAVTPQSFRTADNSGGFFSRLFRNSIVSMSQISDSVMGQPLPLIYTTQPFPVTAMVVDGADEGDFYEAIGIIGEGPLQAFGDVRRQTLDGQPQHDIKFPPRMVLGADPAGATDYLSLSYNGDQRNGDWRLDYIGNSTFRKNLSAGLAFLNIRRTDEKGIQYTALDTHTMEARILQGLKVWSWTSPGTRVEVLGSNVIWVTLDAYFRALYLREASVSDQEATFDVTAAIAAAAICDQAVAKVVGSGVETQFQFIGLIRDQRPVRDWMQDILANCLGTFTFVAGKLRISCRSNTSSVAAFTSGNLLFQSVRCAPPGRQFNRFVATFSDAVTDAISGIATINGIEVQLPGDTQYLPNTATAYDEDFALELGGGGVAKYFEGQSNLSGTSNISQAQRIANVRLREEVGGTTAAERKAHRRVRGTTTVLGLDFAAGDVISVADPEVPGGSCEIRVATWRLAPDYTIQFEGNTVVDSMYDLVAGVRPADVVPGAVPPEGSPWPFRMQWQPNKEVPDAGDPIYASGNNAFGLQQRYVQKGDPGKQALLDVIGVQPVTVFLADTYAPVVRTLTPATTGGSLPGDRVFWISICAFNADGVSPPCKMRAVKTAAGTNTNQFTLSNIAWPAPPAGGSWDGYAVFVAIDDEKTSCNQAYVTAALPSSIVVGGPLKISTWGLPSPTTRRVVVMGKQIKHFGLFGEQVTAVTTNKITIARLAGLSDDYTGRILSVVADFSDGSANLHDFTITAHNLTTGELTLSPDPAAAGVDIGDLATVLLDPNIYTGLTIGDAKFVNGIYPGGLVKVTVDEEANLLVRGITPGLPHQLRRVVSNTATTYTVDRAFDYPPLFFIVEEAAWRFSANGSDVHNLLSDAEVTISMVVDNLIDQPMLVGAFLEDRNGNLTPEELAVIRFTFLYGQTGISAAIDDGFYDAPIVADEVVIDLTNGLNQRITLNQATRVTIKNPIYTGGTIKPGSWLQLYILQDATGQRPSPAFESDYGADVAAEQIDDTASTRTAMGLTFDGSKWRVDISRTGLPV